MSCDCVSSASWANNVYVNFFFKQKTSDDMRISDWSSDVCSSDLDVALKCIGYFRDSWPDNLDDPLKLVEDDCYYQSIVPTTDPIRGKATIKELGRAPCRERVCQYV